MITSGAIQEGVPIKVFRRVKLSDNCPATPKSQSFTSPSGVNKIFAANFYLF